MTNYEYIRGLPLEEMAKEITNLELCENCERKGDWDCYAGVCQATAAKWLKSERKEDENA